MLVRKFCIIRPLIFRQTIESVLCWCGKKHYLKPKKGSTQEYQSVSRLPSCVFRGQRIINIFFYLYLFVCINHPCKSARGGVEDTRLEAKTKGTKKYEAKDSLSEDRTSRGQGQECLRPRPRTKDSGASVLKKKKFFKKVFQAISISLA